MFLKLKLSSGMPERFLIASFGCIYTVLALHIQNGMSRGRRANTLSWIAGVSKTVLSPAFEAARSGNDSLIRQMFADGWDPHEEDKHGSNALLWAAGGGHLNVCRFLVEDCGIPVEPRASDKSSASKNALKRRRNALHWAARHGHLDVCKYAATNLKGSGWKGEEKRGGARGLPVMHTLNDHKSMHLLVE